MYRSTFVRRGSLALMGGGLVMLVLGVLTLAATRTDDEAPSEPTTISDYPTLTPATTAANRIAGPMSTALPAATAGGRPAHFFLARDDTVPEVGGTGVLFLDPETGGGELWDFSNGGAFVRSPMRMYRYVTYEGPGGRMLLDTADGSERLLEFDGLPLTPVQLSPDGTSFVGTAGANIGLFSIETLEPIAWAGDPPAEWTVRAPIIDVDWTPDGSSVAIATMKAASHELFVIANGDATPLDGPSATLLRWSRDGTRLATIGPEATVIYDVAEGRQIEIPARGLNPRWSPDDAYLAIAHPDNIAAARVFDARTGEEVLRINGWWYCVADYWYADGSIAGGGDYPSSVSVPDGAVTLRSVDSYPDASAHAAGDRYVASDGPSPKLISETGDVLAMLSAGRPNYWSFPLDLYGLSNVTDDGRGVVQWGLGPHGICGAGWEEAGVELPPFESTDWPDSKPES